MLGKRRPGCVLVGILAVVGVAGSGACGKTPKANADGGDGPSTAPDAITGRHAFDVVAVLTASGPSSSGLPPANSFTLVLDADAGLAIVGGNGRGAAVAVASADGRTFQSATPFTVGVGVGGNACSGLQQVQYDSFEVTIAGGSLTGSARGSATISCGDCGFIVPFNATLTGASDATPPTLRGSGALPANPFAPFRLLTSEPLPASATARLVADDGAAIDLVPEIVDGGVPLIVAFSKPYTVLRAGQGYVVTLDGLVDFAGQSDPVGPPLRLTSFVAAPTVPEDGFESATGTALGGAMVVTAGPPPAIAGNTSLYIGPPGAPGLDSSNGRSLMVRLSRQAGDATLRFSYRLVAPQAQLSFSGVVVRVGSEGASPGPGASIVPMGPSEMLTLAGNAVYASPIAMTEVALPADATDEVLVVIAPIPEDCLPLPDNWGLLIDDLRLE